jgi:hypothetical protein
MKLCFLIVFAIVPSAHAQNFDRAQRIFIQTDVVEFLVDDDDTLFVKGDKRFRPIQKRLFRNDHALDSSGLTGFSLRRVGPQIAVGVAPSYRELIVLNGSVKRFFLETSVERVATDFDAHYILSELGVYEIDYLNIKKGKRIFDLTRTLCQPQPCVEGEHEILEKVTKLFGYNYFVEGCIESEHGPGCDTKRYYLVNSESNTVTNVTSKLAVSIDPSCQLKLDVDVVAKTLSEEFFKININKVDDICKANIKNTFIIDRDLNVLREALPFGKEEWGLEGPGIKGSVFRNGKLALQFYSSILDDKTSILVPYNFNPQLDYCMYMVFHDQILAPKDLAELKTSEREILKHLIYAKHNVRFEQQFYQGYFNLFAFYNGSTKTSARVERDKVVLTANDTRNLMTIDR